MALNDIYNLAFGEPGFKARVIGGVIKAAFGVMVEAAGTANHANRLAWAMDVLANPQAEGGRMLVLALHDAALQANGNGATDAQIETAIATIIGFAPALTALGYG
jgi:hypothetical protein